MRPNHKLLFSFIAGISIVLSGCGEKEPPIKDMAVIEEGNVAPIHKAESTQPTAILGTGGSLKSLLSQTFTNKVEPEQARHIVVDFFDLDTYEAEISAAYQRGAMITVVNPVGTALNEWCASKGMMFYGDPEVTGFSSLVSFNRKSASMSVQKTDKRNEEEEIEEDLVPMVVFTDWLDKMLKTTLMGPDYRSRDIKKRVAPQRVSHVFSIDLPENDIEATGWGLPENASLHTTAELSCDVYPLHSFADNTSFTGDFYAVEAELTIHNGNLYNGRWQYSQGDKRYESSGFYLATCGLTARLYEHEGNGMTLSRTHTLAGGPAPLSTDPTAAVQTGFEWGFDGWLSGGNALESATPIPLQEGGWIWNYLSEEDPLGADILTDTEGGDVVWRLTTSVQQNNPEEAVQSIATGDLTFRCSWIWAVPQATDNSEGRYCVWLDLNPVYLWTRSLLPGKALERNKVAPKVRSACLLLLPPSRVEGQRI